MENFEFANSTRIIFGKGTENQIGKELKACKKVLLHYGESSIKKSGLYERVTSSLRVSGVAWVELGGVKPNPLLSLVYEGIRICREEQVDFILAVGGGSVIDSAKAIAAGTGYSGDVWDFYTNRGSLQAALPVGVILTIAAAGSESSDGSVITNAEGQQKRAFGNKLLYPRFAILNPELTYTLPPYQTACGISDICAHILERYFTKTQNVDLTDRLCEAALKTMTIYGPRLMANPGDYAARAEVMWTGAIAHNSILGTGRSGDWATHMIEHELSGIYDVTHGAGLAVVFPAWMLYTYKEDLQRFVQFAVRVWDVDLAFADSEGIALEGIARMKRFFSSLGMPVSLKELNIGSERLEEMAAKAVAYGPLGQFKKLDQAGVLAILQLAL